MWPKKVPLINAGLVAVYGMLVLRNCNILSKLKYLGHKERQAQEHQGLNRK